MIKGKLFTGDGTILRTQNSIKKNYNQNKIDRHLAYIENKLEEYNAILVGGDGDVKKKKEVKARIFRVFLRVSIYEEYDQVTRCNRALAVY